MHRSKCVLLLSIFLFAPALLPTAAAATRTVTSTADSGAGSLRQALADASSGDTITFGLPLPATITLTSGELLVDKNLTIAGPGPALLTVRRGAETAFRVIEVTDVVAAISGLTVSGGLVNDYYVGYGGGIFNVGALTLTNVVVSHNEGTYGGGIHSTNSLTLIDSAVVDNVSNDGYGYGAGGLEHWGPDGSVKLVRSLVARNSAAAWVTAIGIVSYGGTSFHAINSTIEGTISNEYNTANYIFDSTTVSGDQPDNPVLWDWYGYYSTSYAPLTLRNSIFRNATGGAVLYYAQGATSLGYNIFSDASGNLTEASDRQNTDAMLGVLQDNGGPTHTFALQPGSPAIDTGSCTDSAGASISTDQRGTARPRGASCDIGAFEAASAHDLQLDRVEQQVTTQLDANVASRATQASVDAVAQSVGALATSVSTTLDAKASQASVDALTLQASVILSNVGALAPAIMTRAAQSSVDDLSSAVSTVSTSVGLRASQASVDALNTTVSSLSQTTATQAQIETLNTAIGGLQGSLGSVASLSTQASVDALSGVTSRLAIERALTDGVKVAVFMLPANAGGYLEVVRTVVDQTIAGMRLIGVDMTKAAASFAKGDASLAAGDYRTAYAWYVGAYQLAIK